MEKEIPQIIKFNLEDTPKGSIKRYWLRIITNGLGSPISIPVIVARGLEEGPILGVTAAVHGNELNGISVIQRLFNEIEIDSLRGTIVGIPVVNIPAFERKKRRFNDGVDLNHIMPGNEHGSISAVYAFRLIDRIIGSFDYLLDLHTASHGRTNSYYVRADMSHPITKKLALLQNAQIIVNNPPSDGTLRGAAEDLGIHAITLEVGNPNTFQKKMIKTGIEGIYNVLSHLNMIEDPIEAPEDETILCDSSFWIYMDRGGLLTVHVNLLDVLKKGQKIATVRNVFGDITKDYTSPEDGIVIGRSISPVNQTGGRILHLGRMK